jgi:hypothetical protein
MEASTTAEDLLRQEASGLAVDDILALCYSLQQKQLHRRLRLYMDVLRRSGGERAQFASALICFDLARQGDATAQLEFGFLADTMRNLAAKDGLVEQLVEGDRYLSYVWGLCRAQLADMELPFVEVDAEPRSVASVDLISEADLEENLPDLEIDDAVMRERFEDALDAFLGGVSGLPIFDAEAGFRLHGGRDTQRVEAFLRELDSVRDFVRLARGYRALALLFYGTHMRSRSIFGVVNARKQEILRAGLAEFVESGAVLTQIAGVLNPLHADSEVWGKVAEVIYDYVGYCLAEPEAAKAGLENYDAVGRLGERGQGRGRFRR